MVTEATVVIMLTTNWWHFQFQSAANFHRNALVSFCQQNRHL